MDKLIEHNENLDTPLHLPSHLENLKEKHKYFEIPNLETKIQRHNIPRYWLQQDFAQIKHFQYRFFQNNILDDDTVPQIEISHFLLKQFRFNNQLLWHQQDQNAYIHFPQIPTEIELLPYVINEANKHLHYRDPTSFNISYLELINLDNQFLVEISEVSDNRPPYTSTNITPEILSEQFDFNILQQQDSQQDTSYSDDNIEQFQNQENHFPTLQKIQRDVNYHNIYQILIKLLQYKMFQNLLTSLQITHNELLLMIQISSKLCYIMKHKGHFQVKTLLILIPIKMVLLLSQHQILI